MAMAAGLAGPVRAQPAAPPALPAPPGTAAVADNLFVDETEVSNLHWLEFLHFVERDSAAAVYRAQLPDTTVWQLPPSPPGPDETEGAAPVRSYLRTPAYRHFPVTGVSVAQARAYCRWRSAVVNQRYFRGVEFRKQHPELRDYDVTVEYRLPTELEWQQAAAGGLLPGARPFEAIQTRPARKPRAHKLTDAEDLVACLDAQRLPHPAAEVAYELPFNLKENYYLAGSNHVFYCAPAKPQFALQAVTAGPPNGYGLYNVVGNVAELTAAPGVAKGGSYKTSAQGLTLAARQAYQAPQGWLGFRCVATVRMARR